MDDFKLIADQLDKLIQQKNAVIHVPDAIQSTTDYTENNQSLFRKFKKEKEEWAMLMFIPANARNGFGIKEVIDKPNWLKKDDKN